MPDLPSPLELARHLMRCPSVTPDDAGCQDKLAALLTDHGFKLQRWRIDGIDNMIAHIGSGQPALLLLGHTDVVPAGDLSAWQYPPFDAHLDDQGMLHGRGACDMKGAVAAMVHAACSIGQPVRGQLLLALTSDEEGPARYGSRSIAQRLRKQHVELDAVLIGEPSSDERLGDTVRIGRRGSLTLKVCVHGQQGHVAYPDLGDNALHAWARLVTAMNENTWPTGGEYFPNTAWQWVRVTGGVADNVIPGTMQAQLNFRYPATTTADELVAQFDACAHRAKVKLTRELVPGAQPFVSQPGPLRACLERVLQEHGEPAPTFDTGGGTSDGRFFADWVPEVLELGARRTTIHAVNECISVKDLDDLAVLYREMIHGFLT